MKYSAQNNNNNNNNIINRDDKGKGGILLIQLSEGNRGVIVSSQTQFINCQVQLPIKIPQHHKHLQIFMDICYVNRMPFLITKPNKVNYIIVSHLKNRSKCL